MKKIAFALCSALLLAACSKDSPVAPGTGTPPVTDTRLQGHWSQVMRIEAEYRNDTLKYTDTNTIDPGGIIFTFSSDSLTIAEEGAPDQERYRYAITGDELLLRRGSEGYFFKLKWYSTDKVSLVEDETYTSSSGVKERVVQESVLVRQP